MHHPRRLMRYLTVRAILDVDIRTNTLNRNLGTPALDIPARYLVFHGSIVLLLGSLYGGPYRRAINRNAPDTNVHAWRVAHASLPLGATLMFAIAAVLSTLQVGIFLKWLLSIALITSSYAFCVSLPLAALTGHRGLKSGGPLTAWIIYAGNILGAGASLLGTLVLVYAGFVSL